MKELLVALSLFAVAMFGLAFLFFLPMVSDEEAPVVVGLTIVLRPATSGVAAEGSGLYSISFNSDRADVELPEGYSLPARVHVFDANSGVVYILLVGESALPADPTVEIAFVEALLQEEIRVGPLQPGLTKVIFK